MKQPWIYNGKLDSLFILSPPFLSLLFIALFPGLFRATASMSATAWIILVVFIDVAHVYSTLYRTYFDRETFRQQKNILIAIPIAGFVVAVMLYYVSSLLFWRVLAYLAVFHFIRQQYGFMRIYSRQEPLNRWYYHIDQIAIYTATIYPLLYWHLHAPRNFHWFVDGDFLYFKATWLSAVAQVCYLIVIVAYIIKECVFVYREKQFNWPRILVILGTFLSWYFGIVYFNGDMAFTLLNVVSHGIPYMALIWVYGKKKTMQPGNRSYGKLVKQLFTEYGALLFVLSMMLLAYMEEGLWDAWIWKERSEVFSVFQSIAFDPGKDILVLLVPLLALPQITHYIIDGYIWKVSKGHIPYREQ